MRPERLVNFGYEFINIKVRVRYYIGVLAAGERPFFFYLTNIPDRLYALIIT